MLKKDKKKDKLSQYVDPTGELPTSELKIAEWYVKHKFLLKKIGTGILAAWCVATVGYSLAYWGYYFAFGYWQDEQMMARQAVELENYDNLKPLYQPQALSFGQTEIYNSVSEQLNDLVVQVTNPNERWLAGVEYKFVYDNGETETVRTIVFPKTVRPLAYFGLKSSFPSNAKIAVEQVVWKRLNPHYYPDVDSFMKERLKFSIENFKFTPASRTQGVPANKLEFDLKNNSAYGFWEADFYLELIDNGGRVGIIYFPVEKFKTGEVRNLDLRSFVSGISVSELALHPVMNIFDKEEYISN